MFQAQMLEILDHTATFRIIDQVTDWETKDSRPTIVVVKKLEFGGHGYTRTGRSGRCGLWSQ
jgi:hypothetical protein